MRGFLSNIPTRNGCGCTIRVLIEAIRFTYHDVLFKATMLLTKLILDCYLKIGVKLYGVGTAEVDE